MRVLLNKNILIFSALAACCVENISGFQIPFKENPESAQDQDEGDKQVAEELLPKLPELPGTRQERNGMLGFYFNPRDPISRLASSWWSRTTERPQTDSRPFITITKPDWFAFLKPTFFRPQQYPSEPCNGTCGNPSSSPSALEQQKPSTPILSVFHPMFLPGTSSAMVLMAQPAMSIPGGGMSVNMQMLPQGLAMLKPPEMSTPLPMPLPQPSGGSPAKPPPGFPSHGQHLIPGSAQPGQPYYPQYPYAPAHPHDQGIPTQGNVYPNQPVITNPNTKPQYPPPNFPNNNQGFPPNGKTFSDTSPNAPVPTAQGHHSLGFDYKLPIPIVTPQGNITNVYLRIQPSLTTKPGGEDESSRINSKDRDVTTSLEEESSIPFLDNQVLRDQLYSAANKTIQEFWTKQASLSLHDNPLIVLGDDEREGNTIP